MGGGGGGSEKELTDIFLFMYETRTILANDLNHGVRNVFARHFRKFN